jgi:CO/xanthine dehydrogenase FAD-binding subunit
VKTALSTLDVARPRTLTQALALLGDTNGAGRPTPLAGGTDLFVYLNAGTLTAKNFVDLWGLRELRGIRAGKTSVTLGSLTTFAEIREHALLKRRFPSLVAAAAEVGARQIQHRATVAGNIANASPAGDSLPVLLAHDAVVHARSLRGERDIPFATIYRGYRDLTLAPDELITGVTLPFAPTGATMGFRKVGTRRAQSISKVVFCGVLRRDRTGRVDHARLAFGSVAPVTLRAIGAEAALLGRKPSAEALAVARAALMSDIAPIDDIRSERDYRLHVAGNVLAQFLRASHAGFARS